MSDTKLDAATLAKTLRHMAGDGSIGWVMEPIQAGFLLDVADALDENAKLQKQGARLFDKTLELADENAKLRELVRDMWNWLAPTAVGGAAPLKGLHDCMRELGIKEDE